MSGRSYCLNAPLPSAERNVLSLSAAVNHHNSLVKNQENMQEKKATLSIHSLLFFTRQCLNSFMFV